jgi:predicted metal-dependent phosphotriesterase family hydrolase
MKTVNRREFLQTSSALLCTSLITESPYRAAKDSIMTVRGPIRPSKAGTFLSHEHILVDFIGADKVSPSRYDLTDVYRKALPFLNEAKRHGCSTFVECTPNYLGRDVRLLKQLSVATGMNILTNTGYYGAMGEKFLPAHAFKESYQQIADKWIAEFRSGIDGTTVRPGFIKTSVDKAPLSAVQKKIIQAAAVTHLQTGLTIGIHTGDGKAAAEELEILRSMGVSPQAYIWIHAQNENDFSLHINAARSGAWIEFDGVNPETAARHIEFLQSMKSASLLNKCLISQDSGWYRVGETGGGKYTGYSFMLSEFVKQLASKGFTPQEIEMLLKRNPAQAFTISVRKL